MGILPTKHQTEPVSQPEPPSPQASRQSPSTLSSSELPLEATCPIDEQDAQDAPSLPKRILKELLVALVLYVATVSAVFVVLATVSVTLLNTFLDVLSPPVPDGHSEWLGAIWFTLQVGGFWLVLRLARVVGFSRQGSRNPSPSGEGESTMGMGLVTVGIVTVALSLAASYVWSFTSYEGTIKRLGGFFLVDCGRVFLAEGRAESRSAVDLCVADAFRQGTPFVARYDEQGFESAVSESYLLSRFGGLYVIHYDSDPSGVGVAAPSFEVTKCQKPPGIVLTNFAFQPLRLQCQ